MGSSSLDLMNFKSVLSPQSPISNWPSLDDIPLNCSPILEHQNDSTSFEEEVEQQPVNIPDLNLPPQESQLGVQGQKKELDRDQRRVAYSCLLERQKDRRLKRTVTREVALMMSTRDRERQVRIVKNSWTYLVCIWVNVNTFLVFRP